MVNSRKTKKVRELVKTETILVGGRIKWAICAQLKSQRTDGYQRSDEDAKDLNHETLTA